jgi:hypothetical protein
MQFDRGTQQHYGVLPYHCETDLMLLVCALDLNCLADAVGGTLLKLLRLWIRTYTYVNINTIIYVQINHEVFCLSSIFQTLGRLAG